MPDPATLGADRSSARPLLRLAAAALVAVAGTACSSSVGDDGAPDRPTHADRHGVLWANVGDGGMSIDAPAGRERWTATFGGFALCNAEPDVTVELDGARLVFDGPQIPAQALIRSTDPADVRRITPRHRSRHLPFYSALGSPPTFAEPYADATLPGRYTDQVAGTRIDTSCDEAADANAALARGRTPADPLTELVVVLHTGPPGAAVRELLVDYQADGQPRTLRLSWRMVACGSTPRLREHCS